MVNEKELQNGGTAVFHGVFNGTLTADSSNIANTFVGPTKAVLDLGSNEYVIDLTAFTPPGPTGSVNAGAIGAHATVTVEPIHPVADSPEPSTLLLAAFAINLDTTYPWGWLAIAGPVCMYWLLAHVSGVPPLEEHMLRSRGASIFDPQVARNSRFPRPRMPWPE